MEEAVSGIAMKKIIDELEKRAEEAFKTSVFEAGVGTGFTQSAEIVRALEGEASENREPPPTPQGTGQALVNRPEPALAAGFSKSCATARKGWTIGQLAIGSRRTGTLLNLRGSRKLCMK